MNATKNQKFDFVFFKIKEKEEYHPLPMLQEFEDELRKYQITWDDLWQIFNSLEQSGYIYKDNENEYHVHPNYVDFIGFESSELLNIQQTNKKDISEKKRNNLILLLTILGTFGTFSGWIVYFSDQRLDKANEQIEILKKERDSIQLIIIKARINYNLSVDSLIKLQKKDSINLFSSPDSASF